MRWGSIRNRHGWLLWIDGAAVAASRKLAPDGLVEEHALTLPCHMGAHGRPSASQPVPPHSKPAPKVRIAAGPKVPTAGDIRLARRASTAPTMGAWLRHPNTAPDFTAVVELARLAPSVHNTQPWLFHAVGDVLTLSGDPARRLPALDPDARQQTISCGAALYLARLAMRLQGFDSIVERPSGSAAEGTLAKIRAVPGSPVTTRGDRPRAGRPDATHPARDL